MLAKKNTGMNAIDATPRTMFCTSKVRFSKMRTLISGESVRRSTTANTTSSTTPTTMLIQIHGLPQPHRADCWNPNTLSPTPPTISARPR